MNKLLPHNIDPSVTHTLFDITHAGIFFGIGGFAYEAAGTIFTSKLYLKSQSEHEETREDGFFNLINFFIYRSNFHHLQPFILLCNLISFKVYGNEKIEKVIFNVYSKDSYMFFCGIIFSAVLVIFVPLYNIANTELLERINWIEKLIKEKDGDKNRTKLIFFRWITFGFFSGLAMMTEDVTVVLNFMGGLVIPFVSFYLPVPFNYSVFP